MTDYKYQVIAHEPYYPTSALFYNEEDAWAYYEKLQSEKDLEDTVVTICEIIGQSGTAYYKDKIEW